MPLIDKQPFNPIPIPDNLKPEDPVFYLDLTNEIFTSHDAFMDRYLYCNSLIWTCGRTGKSGLTYKEALDSEQSQNTAKIKKKPGRKPASSLLTDDDINNSQSKQDGEAKCKSKSKTKSTSKGDTSIDPNNINSTSTSNGGEETDDLQPPVKKKKKKYPYDPKKYSMPVPEGFDPSLLTPTGKIDGRKLKSKKNKTLAEELLSTSIVSAPPKSPGKNGKGKKAEEAKRKEEEAKKKEEEVKRKAQLQAELAKERELEAKRKKEAAALTRQLERQKKDEERRRATAWLANWEKKCDDLERDDLRRLPQPTPVNCDIPERLFGDAIFIMEAMYNFYDLYTINEIYPDGNMSFDTLEEILIDKQEEGALGTLLMFLLKTIFFTQPTKDGYGLDDDSTIQQQQKDSSSSPVENANSGTTTTTNNNINGKDDVKMAIENGGDVDMDHNDEGYDANGVGSEADEDEHHEEEEDDESDDKDVNMNDLIGSAIKAAQEVKKCFSKPLPEMELTHQNVTEILRLHLLQSGSFPKGRTIYNGWYSSREDPGLWLCMQEPDLIKKLGEGTVYSLDIEERIKILHTLIYQLLTFIKTRVYMEMASDQLTELRKLYRKEAADFARWDRENCVKRMQPPKKKNDQMIDDHDANQEASTKETTSAALATTTNLKSCLKSNGTNNELTNPDNNNDMNDHLEGGASDQQQPEQQTSKKKITFHTAPASTDGTANCLNGQGPDENGGEHHHQHQNQQHHDDQGGEDQEQSYEELERAYQQNTVDYEDYQREKAIRSEQLNQTLLDIRINLRNHQSVYAVHPIGRDRAYRRYWLFQSLPGLFVEQEDEFVGKCLPSSTPLESRYKKLFGKDNPLMHPNEADLIRTKTCDVACSTEPIDLITPTTTTSIKNEPQSDLGQQQQQQQQQQSDPQETKHIKQETGDIKQEASNDEQQPQQLQLDSKDVEGEENHQVSDNNNRLNGVNAHGDGEQQQQSREAADSLITDEMNYCTGDEETCLIHGKRRPTQPKWWFYHQRDSIDKLVESLNRRGHRESELHDILAAESSILKPKIAECPAYKLNKDILEQSGIRRSRRLRVKGGKRRARKDFD